VPARRRGVGGLVFPPAGRLAGRLDMTPPSGTVNPRLLGCPSTYDADALAQLLDTCGDKKTRAVVLRSCPRWTGQAGRLECPDPSLLAAAYASDAA